MENAKAEEAAAQMPPTYEAATGVYPTLADEKPVLTEKTNENVVKSEEKAEKPVEGKCCLSRREKIGFKLLNRKEKLQEKLDKIRSIGQEHSSEAPLKIQLLSGGKVVREWGGEEAPEEVREALARSIFHLDRAEQKAYRKKEKAEKKHAQKLEKVSKKLEKVALVEEAIIESKAASVEAGPLPEKPASVVVFA
ncbi:unnamed protein product, partial [Mesorhabditis spiculigera]